VFFKMASCHVNNAGGLGSCIWASKLATIYLMSCSIRGGHRAGISLMASELIAFHSNVSVIRIFRRIVFLHSVIRP
jgi:hypothetical protein